MSKSISFLNNLARMAHDIRKISPGDSKKIAGEAKNKLIGREIIKKFWRLRSFLKLPKVRRGIK